MKIAVGDEVRVHFHPPGPMRSYSEGMIRRVDVTTPEGRFFEVEVTREVILDQEHRIRPGFQDYVRYEGQNDLPGRIEPLSAIKQSGMENDESRRDTGLSPVEIPDEIAQELKAEQEQFLVHLERQEVRRRGGLIAALFGRQR
ncbi:hypothetical protein [Microvirga sp. VF16]|uniref:hypothetical protein n=1 Tax=Microvirga sp. VF16 TaxID=2807101 RepID=UPI00193E0365|nr:hypothetical protein [Microvirga sp. VF16]QRM28306.1 hypothetical protein JO965_18985 [Microvirga sp. VF16]